MRYMLTTLMASIILMLFSFFELSAILLIASLTIVPIFDIIRYNKIEKKKFINKNKIYFKRNSIIKSILN